MLDRILFQYNEKDYVFQPKKRIQGKVLDGAVYLGEFVGDAPGSLRAGETYCLKRVTALDPTTLPYAAIRECYDLIPFQGAHLRQVLLLSDSAKKAAEQIILTGKLGDPVDCMVIEPYYYSLKDYFTNCGAYSVAERLDIVRQFALGSEELSENRNRIAGSGIVAHRDLKWQNGVTESKNGELHIRLIDFATIRLDKVKSVPIETTIRLYPGTVKNGTFKSVYSTENTSPESVLPEYEVSEKTDVYALGMMLASLFMRWEEKYINPNDQWLKRNGWPTDDEVDAGKLTNDALVGAIRTCRGKYDTNPRGIESWIEKDLPRVGVNITWEALENGDLLRRIRELFRDAVRIDPEKRVSRRELIEALDELIKLADGATGRRKVSVYLFNEANARGHKADYQVAAAKVFQQEAIGNGGEAVSALFISYTSPREGDHLKDCLYGQTNAPCSTEADLLNAIGEMKSGWPDGPDLLLYGIHAAATFLNAHKERYQFSGRVYLFTPQIPAADDMMPMKIGGQSIDLEMLCEGMLDVLGGTPTELCAYTVQKPDPSAADLWDYQLITDIKNPDPKPNPADNGNTAGGYTFDVSPTALYVTLPGGKRVNVGIIDPQKQL